MTVYKNSDPPPAAFSLKKYPKKKETDIKKITATLKKIFLFKTIKLD